MRPRRAPSRRSRPCRWRRCPRTPRGGGAAASAPCLRSRMTFFIARLSPPRARALTALVPATYKGRPPAESRSCVARLSPSVPLRLRPPCSSWARAPPCSCPTATRARPCSTASAASRRRSSAPFLRRSSCSFAACCSRTRSTTPRPARAFKAALALDPNCAMCAWGVAKAERTQHQQHGSRRPHRCTSLSGLGRPRTSPSSASRERALIEASQRSAMVLEGRHGQSGRCRRMRSAPSGGAAKAHPLDIVYAARMRALADALPRRSRHPGAVCRGGDDRDAPRLVGQERPGKPAGEIGIVTERLERAVAARPPGTPDSTTS